MEIDLFVALCKVMILLIYGAIFIIAIIFTFFIEVYNRLDDLLNLEIFSPKTITPLDRNIDSFDNWLNANNRIIGPLFILLSIFDMCAFSKALNVLL